MLYGQQSDMLSLGTVHSEFPPSFYVYVLIPSACNASCDSNFLWSEQPPSVHLQSNICVILVPLTLQMNYFFC